MILRSFVLPLLTATVAYSQTLMEGLNSGRVALLPQDAAILEGREVRTDLGCAVKSIDPHLGFDLRFHGGYEIRVPLHEMTGNGNILTAVTRIIPEGRPDAPVYFSQKWVVPPLLEDARGETALQGAFVLGEGKYQVEWLLRDQRDRFCTNHWQIVVGLRGKDRQIPLRQARDTVAPEPIDFFDNDAPVKRVDQQSLNVLVLFHIAPHTQGAISMRAAETQALLAILRRIAQESLIGKYSMVAFNLDQSTVLYRRQNADQIDFPELRDAFQQLRLGTIEVQRLREKDNETVFLGNLLREEIGRSRPDAVIFVGSRIPVNSAEWNRSLRQLGEPRCPVFYLNYTPDLALNPWRDLIGNVVKLWKGSEYVISKPADLFTSWTEIMTRLSSQRSPSIGASDRTSTATGLVPKK